MKTLGKYLYCVVGAVSEGPGKLQLGPGITLVNHRDISAVIRDSEAVDYQAIPKEIVFRHLNAHQLVIEKVMHYCIPIPFKFGTWVESAAEVEDILKKGYCFFKDTLNQMKGKVEIEVIASFHALQEVFCEIAEHDTVKDLKNTLLSKPGGATESDRIELGRVVESLLSAKKAALTQEIGRVLRNHCEAHCPHGIFNDQMIFNDAFLVTVERKEDFYRAVEELDTLHKDRIDFKCVGPLPSYTFNTIEVQDIDLVLFEEARRILELDEAVTLNKIKDHYRSLAEKCHPDRQKPSNTRYEDLSRAYEMLIDFCSNHTFSLSPDTLQSEKIFRRLKIVA